MTTLAKAHLPFFEVIVDVPKKQCKVIMESLNKHQVNAICEVLLNLRYGQIELSEEDKRKVQRRKTLIRLLTSKSTTLKVRRAAIIKQSTYIANLLRLLVGKIREA